MKLHDVMSRDVKTVEAQATIAEAARIMKKENVGLLPVMGPLGTAIGVITDRDIALRTVADGLPSNAQVREAMSPMVYSVQDDQDLQAAIDLMNGKKVERVLVTDRFGTLVGVLSINDAAILCNGDSRITKVNQVMRNRITDARFRARLS